MTQTAADLFTMCRCGHLYSAHRSLDRACTACVFCDQYVAASPVDPATMKDQIRDRLRTDIRDFAGLLCREKHVLPDTVAAPCLACRATAWTLAQP